MGRKWTPSTAQKEKYISSIKELEVAMEEARAKGLNVSISSRQDSIYIKNNNGQEYRISNHSVNSSDDGMFKAITECFPGGEPQIVGWTQRRESYHQDSNYTKEIICGKIHFPEKVREVVELCTNGI